MTDATPLGRPDLVTIMRRNAARKSGDPARSDVIRLVSYIDALEERLRRYQQHHAKEVGR